MLIKLQERFQNALVLGIDCNFGRILGGERCETGTSVGETDVIVVAVCWHSCDNVAECRDGRREQYNVLYCHLLLDLDQVVRRRTNHLHSMAPTGCCNHPMRLP